MKKFTAIVLACFAAFTLASCSEKVPAGHTDACEYKYGRAKCG